MNKKIIYLAILVLVISFSLGIPNYASAGLFDSAWKFPSCCITGGTTCTTMNSKADYDACVAKGGDTQNMACSKWSACNSLSGTASGSAEATTNTSSLLSGTASGSAEATTNTSSLLSGTASTASSAATTSSTGIVPCGKSGGSPCTLCHLLVGIQRLVTFGKNILVTVAIVGIVIAGLIYMISSGSEAMITTAKNCFKASIVGFAITLSAWLAINTILLYILGPSSNSIGATLKTWNYIICDTTSSTTTSSSSGTGTTSAATTAQNQADCKKYCTDMGGSETVVNKCYDNCMAAKTADSSTTTGEKLSESATKEKLDECNITYDKNNTATLKNMRDTTVQELCNLKKESGCDINVTSGTGGTHSTLTGYNHSNGYKFDFTANSCIDSYLKDESKGYTSHGKRDGANGDNADMYQSTDSNRKACYARENTIWDMSVAACYK